MVYLSDHFEVVRRTKAGEVMVVSRQLRLLYGLLSTILRSAKPVRDPPADIETLSTVPYSAVAQPLTKRPLRRRRVSLWTLPATLTALAYRATPRLRFAFVREPPPVFEVDHYSLRASFEGVGHARVPVCSMRTDRNFRLLEVVMS